MSEPQQVYVALLDEGVDCWRQVDAQHVGEDQYVLSGPIPGDEVWEFQPGETVRYRERTFQGGATGLVAPEFNVMPNPALERTAGSHPLAAAAQRDR